MFRKVIEGKAQILVPEEEKISKSLPVFYNPVMKFNRDVAVLIIKALGMSNASIGLPLAGTGVRGIRMMLEAGATDVFFNDNSAKASRIIRKNFKLNGLKGVVENKDANRFILSHNGFDYIDIDPFGSPNPFLDSAVKRLSRNGVLAITATDTAALCGTYPKVCMRNYWAVPRHDELMYEIGLRILIRKAQLVAAQYEKALVPIYSYFKDHYFRVYLRCRKGKSFVDKVIEKQGMFQDSGPMWLGELWDQKLAERIASGNMKFLRIIADEAKIKSIGYFDIHRYSKKLKLQSIPKHSQLISRIKKKNSANVTHFLKTAIRTDMAEEDFEKIIQQLS